LEDILEGNSMQSATQSAPGSKKMLWVGRILSAIAVLMLLFSGSLKLFNLPDVLKEFDRLGYLQGAPLTIGILEIACTIIYAIPQTSVLGAILLTGYLGGAVATHVRIDDSFDKLIGPIIPGVLIWLGLFLRDQRLRALLPLRSSANAKPAVRPGNN
jgi:DoxX-like family